MKLSSEMLKTLSYINIKKSQSLEVELVNFHADWRLFGFTKSALVIWCATIDMNFPFSS